MPESDYDAWKTTDPDASLSAETVCEEGGERIKEDEMYRVCAYCDVDICNDCWEKHHAQHWKDEHPEDAVNQNAEDT